MSHLLEIAVFNIEAALQAAKAGADRLELCENPHEGGITPSYGTLKAVRTQINIPVFPIIRPRGGDFLYTEAELEVMEKDLLLSKELGFEGVVLGVLKPDGDVDTVATSKLVSLAYPMEVTFHRAFDRAAEPMKALEDIIACGCNRILTSGQVPNAADGKVLIKQLIEKAGDRITIMPGSGVRAENIAELAAYTGAVELHSSARKQVPSAMQYHQHSMQEENIAVMVDAGEITNMKQALAVYAASLPVAP